jgi:proteic killer suppression protein
MPMIQSFKDRGTEDLFEGIDSKRARRTCPKRLWRVAQRRMDEINQAASLGDLGRLPGNRLHALHGDRLGEYAIAINRQYRLCFVWTPDGPSSVEITDYH